MSELLKPEDLPRFATAATAEVEEPSEAKKDTGWVAEKPPHEYMNWLHKSAYDNLAFIMQELGNKAQGRAKYDPKLAQILKIPFNANARVTRNYVFNTSYPGIGYLFLGGNWIIMPYNTGAADIRLYKIRKHDLVSDGYVTLTGIMEMQDRCVAQDYVFITHGSEGKITKLNRETLGVMATWTMGFSPYHIISDGTTLWVHDGGTNIYRVNMDTGAIIATVATGATSFSWMFCDGYNHILVLDDNGGSDRVLYLNMTTNAMEAYNLPISAGYSGTAAFDGKNLWTSNQTSIEVYDPVEFSLVKTITRGAANLGHPIFTGTKMLFPDIISGTVMRQFDIFSFDEVELPLGATIGAARNMAIYDGLNAFVPMYSGGGPYAWYIGKFWPGV